MKQPTGTTPRRAFSLFEALIALGVFAIAFTGIALAIDSALSAVLESRTLSESRRVLESRLAYCQADPPPPGTPRTLESGGRFEVRESTAPFEATNAKGESVPGLLLLEIAVVADGITNRAETLLYRP
jgi:type II secretory pathway component PulJ